GRPATNKVGGNHKYEIYDFPSDAAQRFNEPDKRIDKVKPEAERLVKLRMEEEDAQHRVLRGTSFCRAFQSGRQFELTGHPSLNGKYVLTALQYAVQQSPDYHAESLVPHPYRNTFTCIPERVPFRAPRVTPKPVVQGLQSAVVVGAAGKEIDVDK